MSLFEKINSDLVGTMKSGNKFDLSVLRMLKSALQLEKISKKHDLSDDEVIAVIKKQVKVRNASITEYTNYNRLDLAEDLKKEVIILNEYLPEEMSIEEITKIVNQAIEETNATNIKDMGFVMKKINSLINGNADMALVSKLVREKLN